MKKRLIYITEYDLERLEDLLSNVPESRYRSRNDIKELANELSKCEVVDSKKIPPDIVTMNSRVQLKDLDSNEEMIFTLVFPINASINEGRMSILSPIGTAIIGYSAGDIIEWKVPAGKRRIKIEEILYQPEASGDYHL